MKRDDRDIICEQDYAPLSNAELAAHIERYARLMHNTPLNDGEWLGDIIDPARVLLARADAAAAEARDLRDRNESLKANYAGFMESALKMAEVRVTVGREQRNELAARVAELTDALAAQQWRPVTDTEPEEADEVELLVVGYRDGGIWYYHDDNPVRGWRPAPEATTP